MDLSASQYNSESESGWTHYLDQSSLSENYFQSSEILDYEGKGTAMKEEDDEEGSMVSDASSGPPIYHDEVDKCSSHSATSQTKKKVKECGRRNQQPPHLDDTASSPVYSFPKKKVSFSRKGAVDNAMDLSQGHSAGRLKVKPKFQKNFDFIECSLAGKHASEEPGGSKRKKENERDFQ